MDYLHVLVDRRASRKYKSMDTKTIVHINTATQLLCPTGKYVPSLAYTIHRNNPTADLKVNLQGKNIQHVLRITNADKLKSYICIRRYVH